MLLLLYFINILIFLRQSVPFYRHSELILQFQAKPSTKSQHTKHVNKVLPGLKRKQGVIGIGRLKLLVLVADLFEQWMLDEHIVVARPYL